MDNFLYIFYGLCYIFSMEKVDKSTNYLKNALVLAYLGDSVFTLMTRKYLVEMYDYKPNTLNKKANSIVCAKNQAIIMQDLFDSLSLDEKDIVMRARNSHINSKAKHSTLQEYSLATQFEALIGYWYLCGEVEKLENVLNRYIKEKV